MDFKSMLQQLSQLSEATKKTPTGLVHTADPGGYGLKFNTGEEGNEKNAQQPTQPAEPRGRGRPKKASGDASTQEKYSGAKDLQSWIVGNLPKKLPGKASVKHSLKEYFEELEEKILQEENQPIPVVGKQGDTQSTGAGFLHISDTSPAGQAMQKALGDLAQQKKAQIVMPTPQQQSSAKPGTPAPAGATGQAPAGQAPVKEKWAGDAKIKSTGEYSKKTVEELKAMLAKLKKSGPHDENSPEAKKQRQINFALRAKGGWKKGEGAAQKESMHMDEADIPSDQVDMGAGLGAGRSQKTFEGKQKLKEGFTQSLLDLFRSKEDILIRKAVEEIMNYHQTYRVMALKKAVELLKQEIAQGKSTQDSTEIIRAINRGMDDLELKEGLSKKVKGKKPDFPDIDKDGNKTEPISKAAKDLKKKKKTVSESMHKHSAARLLGKAHALAKEGYNCKYDSMEETKMYHEGYKEGLDECYGQGVYEDSLPATTSGMASQAMPVMDEYDYDMDEGNAFTAALARTPKGGSFTVGGKSFTDRSNYDSKLDELAFESFDKQLNALLNEDSVSEGMTVSISKGQQGMPNSVTVSAQDGEADQLLGFIKQAGLGIFGDDSKEGYGIPDKSEVAHPHGNIHVVDDNDGMMAIMKKIAGIESGYGDGDYEEEEDDHDHHDHGHDEECETCGEVDCECDSDELEEMESYDQETEEVAEDNPPDSGAAETTADEEAEAQEDMAIGISKVKEEEEEITEWANDAGERAKDFDDESFQTDIDFITKTISGGLNKPKSTGQTTIPVIAGQNDRMNANESINQWKKLAGI